MHHFKDLLPVFIVQVGQKMRDDWWKWALAAMAALILLGVNDKINNISESDREVKALIRSHMTTTEQEFKLVRERLVHLESINEKKDREGKK